MIGLFMIGTRARADQPSWFPKQSCRVAWKDQARDRYQFGVDERRQAGVGNVGYKNYQDRIAREKGVKRSDCYKDWTILVYMAADNDLHPYALWDLEEMEGAFASGQFAGSTLKSDLIVQLDSLGRTGIRRLHVFQAPGTSYVPATDVNGFKGAGPERIRSPIISLMDEKTAATSVEHRARFESYLDSMMREYPAEQYMVIVWGHGQGWAGSLRQQFGGFAFSETPGDYLAIPSLREIFERTVAQTLENKRLIDVYAADACLMQMIEVAYELSATTRFIIGSAQVQSFLGLPYRQLMYQINSGHFGGASPALGRSDEGLLVAKMLPALAQESLDPVHGQQGRADRSAHQDFTMSALSSGELRQQLVPALRDLGLRLVAYMKEDPLRAMDLQALIQTAPSFMGGAKELGSFNALLRIALEQEQTKMGQWTSAAQSLYDQTDQVRDALTATVLSNGLGSTYLDPANPLHLLGFRAVGIWLPLTTQEYQTRSPDFAKSLFFSNDVDPIGPASPTKKPPGLAVASWGDWLHDIFEP